MADPDDLSVAANTDFQLRLVVGGNYPVKWTVYEYTPKLGPPLGEGTGTKLFAAGQVAKGVERKFVWSATVVTNDDTTNEIDVVGQVCQGNVVKEVSGKPTVSKDSPDFFVNLWVIGQ